jgi:hypothetical protein
MKFGLLRGQGAIELNCGSTARTCRGQGATEYLVLLAIVLIIALVAIALLGYFPGISGDARRAQSDSYWRGDARPFAILEHFANSSSISIVAQNLEADQRTMTNFTFSTSYSCTNGSWQSPLGTNISSLVFAGGEKKTMLCGTTLCSTAGLGPGGTYDVNVTIKYDSPDAAGQVQFGAKNLIGKCS